MSNDTFYDRLPVLNDFAEVAHPEQYTPVPGDWMVAVGDVRDSTGAIDEGLYKEVNMVGASVIAAVLNAIGHRSVPYVFAGDGAALCVPGTYAEAVEAALGGARRMADESFGLRLDVGLVPVQDLVQDGHTIMVARYRLSDDIVQAVFLGSGLYVAEERVKADPTGPYGIPASVTGPVDFEGLQCRWDNVPSHREEIVALLVHATGTTLQESADIYDEVLDRLRDIYGAEESSRPVLHSQLQMNLSPQGVSPERSVQTHDKGWWERLSYWPRVWIQGTIGRVLMALDWATESTDWGTYRQDLETHTDFRKMDGTLRQVIAGTQAQREELEQYLESEYEKGRLIYGLDTSESAMITCLVFQYEKEHVHFVDGADGGYANAARDLKERED